MIELPALYDHQQQQLDAVRSAMMQTPNVILCANPGVGKTRISKWVMASAANKEREIYSRTSGYSLFCVHRRSLVDNASDSFSESPALPHGIIMSGRETDWSKRAYVGSIDTILSWFCGDGYDSSITFDLLVFDECHSHLSKFRTFLAEHNKKREEMGLKMPFCLGLSATPDAKNQGDIFGQIVTGKTTEWLIENGYLSGFRYFQAVPGKLELLVKRGKEFTKESVSAAMDGLAGDLVRDWMQYGKGRPTVGFFPRLSHAREAQAELVRHGIRAEYVDGETPDDKRRSLFKALDMGYIDYLCNVGVVERGTNIPAIQCVQLCTAVGSVSRYRQMIGRGSRTAEGKEDCVVIDHGGNVKRHGFFEDEIEWTLDVSTGKTREAERKPEMVCPGCHAIYRGGRCKNCQYEPTPKERKGQGLEFDGKELKEIKPEDTRQRAIKSNEELLVSALFIAGHRKARCGTWRMAVSIAAGNAKKQGTRFVVPKTFQVGGREYFSLAYGDPASMDSLHEVFPFIRRKEAVT